MRNNEVLTVPETILGEWEIADCSLQAAAQHADWVNPDGKNPIERMQVCKKIDGNNYMLALYRRPRAGVFTAGPAKAFSLSATEVTDAIMEVVRIGTGNKKEV